MMGFGKKLVQIGALAVLTVGNVLGADATFEKDFQEQVVGTMVKHDFAENAGNKYVITKGMPDKPGAWQWNGSKSIFFGTVELEKDDASASHLGTFSGKMIRKGNDEKGGNGDKPEELTWAGKITGQAVKITNTYCKVEIDQWLTITGKATTNVVAKKLTLDFPQYNKVDFPLSTKKLENVKEIEVSFPQRKFLNVDFGKIMKMHVEAEFPNNIKVTHDHTGAEVINH